jgi:hypothetical protein
VSETQQPGTVIGQIVVVADAEVIKASGAESEPEREDVVE